MFGFEKSPPPLRIITLRLNILDHLRFNERDRLTLGELNFGNVLLLIKMRCSTNFNGKALYAQSFELCYVHFLIQAKNRIENVLLKIKPNYLICIVLLFPFPHSNSIALITRNNNNYYNNERFIQIIFGTIKLVYQIICSKV